MQPFSEARDRGLDAVRAGRMDGMPWMSAERINGATDLAARYPWGRSILALAWPYRPAPALPPPRPGVVRGRTAAYACLDGGDDGGPGDTRDYHDLLGERCDLLLAWLRARTGEVRAKRFVDHGWAMDRAIAERAGIGFIGKHSSLITPGAGSYVLLAEMVISIPLPPDPPSKRACGTCTACLPACPTGAIVAPGMIDARRCISYLTIEHRGPIPLDLRPLMGTWVFGCDLCQEACPINHLRAPEPMPAAVSPSAPGPVPHPDLVDLLNLDDAMFDARYRGTVLRRTGRDRLARNAAIALGNAGDRAALAPLTAAAAGDRDPVVREAASWAIARLVDPTDGPDGPPGQFP
jgi:epoxyqueuosine reductase